MRDGHHTAFAEYAFVVGLAVLGAVLLGMVLVRKLIPKSVDSTYGSFLEKATQSASPTLGVAGIGSSGSVSTTAIVVGVGLALSVLFVAAAWIIGARAGGVPGKVSSNVRKAMLVAGTISGVLAITVLLGWMVPAMRDAGMVSATDSRMLLGVFNLLGAAVAGALAARAACVKTILECVLFGVTAGLALAAIGMLIPLLSRAAGSVELRVQAVPVLLASVVASGAGGILAGIGRGSHSTVTTH